MEYIALLFMDASHDIPSQLSLYIIGLNQINCKEAWSKSKQQQTILKVFAKYLSHSVVLFQSYDFKTVMSVFILSVLFLLTCFKFNAVVIGTKLTHTNLYVFTESSLLAFQIVFLQLLENKLMQIIKS